MEGKTKQLIILIIITGLYSCGSNRSNLCQEDIKSSGGISVASRRFIDAYGRQVIFNGINYVNKDPGSNYVFNDSSDVFNKFRQWGFNCIRLGIFWDGIEPEPGKYDEKYLDKVEEKVKVAIQSGLYVLLDMHQDLYGVSLGDGNSSLGDGAPHWATITDGMPHSRGSVWSDSYILSRAVQRAFDNFWANKPAIDGIGLQDHYAAMWRHVAERFRNYDGIIGYDVMNEPFNGTQGVQVLSALLKTYASLNTSETGVVLSENELEAMWATEESRFKALELIGDSVRYNRIISSGTDINQQFERNELHSMYQRVSNRIREVDTTHILFLEHGYFSNAGILSGLLPVVLKNGRIDTLVAYAAHGYDLLVDTKNYSKGNNDRVEFIFSQVNRVSERIGMPVLVGEWGAFPGNSEGIIPMAQFTRRLFDRYQFSNTYWAYYPEMEYDKYLSNVFKRPNPQYINGTLKTLDFNYDTGEFECSWDEQKEKKYCTVFFIPDISKEVRNKLVIFPATKEYRFEEFEKGNGGLLIINASGKNLTRSIRIMLK